jgi:hypothetical protein
MDTNKHTKQAATSVAASAGALIAVPGAQEVSMMSDKQDFQKTTLTDGPTHCPEDHQPLSPPSSFDDERVSSARAARGSHNKKANTKKKKMPLNIGNSRNAELARKDKQIDGTESCLGRHQQKTRSHRASILPKKWNKTRKTKTSGIRPLVNSRDLTGIQEDDLKMAAVESKQEVEQDEEDEDEENLTSGAVRVSGVNSRDSTGIQEDDVRMAAVETMQEELTCLIIEAHLVMEEDTRRMWRRTKRRRVQRSVRRSV